jgi:hypothetical protein
VAEDRADHRTLQDRRDDLHLPADAKRHTEPPRNGPLRDTLLTLAGRARFNGGDTT